MTTSIQSNASDSALLVNGQTALQFNQGGTQGRIPSVTCTQGSGALTFGLNPCVLDFRSTTLTTGVTTPRLVNSALSLVLPSGGTLGAVTTVSARLIVVAIDNAGTVELAVVNIAGGNDLSETGVINTTAISASSTSNNVFYSTTARTGVAYRVVGAVDAVNTAGAWGNPTLVQPAGGMFTLPVGRTFSDVKALRTSGTTYYNTGNKDRYVYAMTIVNNQSVAWGWQGFINGIQVAQDYIGGNGLMIFAWMKVPPFASYQLTNTTNNPMSFLYLFIEYEG